MHVVLPATKDNGDDKGRSMEPRVPKLLAVPSGRPPAGKITRSSDAKCRRNLRLYIHVYGAVKEYAAGKRKDTRIVHAQSA